MRVVTTVEGTLVQLSPRERQVLRLLAHGETNKAIGYALTIKLSTVKGHIAHMRAELDVANRVQLTLWAIAHPQCMAGFAVEKGLVLPFAISPN